MYGMTHQKVLKTGIIASIFNRHQPIASAIKSIYHCRRTGGANPYCDKVADNYQGTCHDRYDLDEETGKATCNDGTHKDDPQDCKDATNNRGGAGTREDDGEFVN